MWIRFRYEGLSSIYVKTESNHLFFEAIDEAIEKLERAGHSAEDANWIGDIARPPNNLRGAEVIR